MFIEVTVFVLKLKASMNMINYEFKLAQLLHLHKIVTWSIVGVSVSLISSCMSAFSFWTNFLAMQHFIQRTISIAHQVFT